MKIGGLGLPELIIILVVALVIFGPKNLPKLGSALGKTVKSVREGLEDKNNIEAVEADEIEIDEDAGESTSKKTKAKASGKKK